MIHINTFHHIHYSYCVNREAKCYQIDEVNCKLNWEIVVRDVAICGIKL
jgi:hypothetical protein